MALNPATLASALSTVSTDSFGSAGNAWASAYRDYAAAAQAGVAVPILTGLEQAVLAAALAAAFAAGLADPTGTPERMEAAFQAFWLAPPVVFGAGSVTLAPPGFAALFRATFPVNFVSPTSQAAAAVIAGALDTWTHTVAVTLPGPTIVTLL